MNYKSYIGTKRIQAVPFSKENYYTKYRNLSVPADENPDDEGYLVKYSDGYISWSPKKQFEEAYRTSGAMNFGNALELMKLGYKVARKGWNGKGMFLYLVNRIELQNILKYGYGEYQGEPTVTDSIAMKTAQNTIVIGWLASQTDMLAEDWEVVDAE